MKSRIGKYTLTADAYQFSLYEDKVIEKGDNAGNVRRELVGHFPKLEQVANRLFSLEIAKSDAETLSEILKVVGATRQLIKTADWTREDLK